MALVMHACEKLLLHYSFMARTTAAKLKVITVGRDGPCCCYGGAFKNHIFIVGYLQFVEGRQLHTALLCPTGYGASAVARTLDRKG